MDEREVSPIRSSQTSKGMDVEMARFANMVAREGDGRLFKMEKDYSSQVDEAIEKADAIAKSGNANAAVESLSSLEKSTRQGTDMKSNARIVQHMVKLCFDGSNWTLLNETITSLSKKRSIIKFAIAGMVRDCCEMIDKLPTEELRDKLITTLRTVTAGKIYVEIERARLTYRVVKKLEAEGKVDEAANMLLDLQVETFGSMVMKEKVELLLEQMRLSLLRKDFIRASIICKKISKKYFEDKSTEVQELKLKYYNLMVEIDLNDKAYLNLCRHFLAIYDTPEVNSDVEKVKQILKCVILYVLLAQHTNEQWDLVHHIHEMRKIELIPEYNILLELFIGEEIIAWKGTIVADFENLLREETPNNRTTGIFSYTEDGNKRWLDFQRRVGEHNMRMISKYYTQITFDRMAELLDYSLDDMEKFLCDLIVSGAIPDAKLHRPSRTVNLRARKAHIEQLDQWTRSVRRLTDILNKVSHLITKEEMVHCHMGIPKATSSKG